MSEKIAYLKMEMTDLEMKKMSQEEISYVDEFKRKCSVGAADGGQDIEWQERGLGYYAHLNEIERLKNIDEKLANVYKTNLIEEIESIESNTPEYYMACIVKNNLDK